MYNARLGCRHIGDSWLKKNVKPYIPAVGAVVDGTVDIVGVVQGLVGLAFEGRTGQLPTVNCTSSMAISPVYC